jgi:hypothetical protein
MQINMSYGADEISAFSQQWRNKLLQGQANATGDTIFKIYHFFLDKEATKMALTKQPRGLYTKVTLTRGAFQLVESTLAFRGNEHQQQFTSFHFSV